MTVAAWVVSSFLVVAVTLIIMGMALRPYVADLISDRNQWRARAELAEAEVEAHIATDVRLVPQIDADASLDIFLKGMMTDDEE